jgi:hypothetical protein
VPTVELNYGFIAALVCIVNNRDRLLPDGVPRPVDPGDQDEAACAALPLHGHPAISLLPSPALLGYGDIGLDVPKSDIIHSPARR